MLVIKNGRIIDPQTNKHRIADLLVEDGKIKIIADVINIEGVRTIHAKGKVVVPGMINMPMYLKEMELQY